MENIICLIVNGNWGAWSDFGSCSATCGVGSEKRTRSCSSPAPAHGGKDCDGSADDVRECKVKKCPPGKINRNIKAR